MIPLPLEASLPNVMFPSEQLLQRNGQSKNPLEKFQITEFPFQHICLKLPEFDKEDPSLLLVNAYEDLYPPTTTFHFL